MSSSPFSLIFPSDLDVAILDSVPGVEYSPLMGLLAADPPPNSAGLLLLVPANPPAVSSDEGERFIAPWLVAARRGMRDLANSRDKV